MGGTRGLDRLERKRKQDSTLSSLNSPALRNSSLSYKPSQRSPLCHRTQRRTSLPQETSSLFLRLLPPKAASMEARLDFATSNLALSTQALDTQQCWAPTLPHLTSFYASNCLGTSTRHSSNQPQNPKTSHKHIIQ